MAKLADAADLKSAGPQGLWGFKSPSRHQNNPISLFPPFPQVLILRSLRVSRFLVLVSVFSPGGAAVSGELDCHQVPRSQRRYESTVEFRCHGSIHADQLSGGLRPRPTAAEAVVEGRGLFWGVVRTQELRAAGTTCSGEHFPTE